MAREPNLPSGYVTSVYFESSASLFPSHPQINTGAALKTSLMRNPSAFHDSNKTEGTLVHNVAS